MDVKNENELLYLIRYTLSILILILTVIFAIFFYMENKSNFEKIKKNTEEKFILAKKQLIKEQIENIYDYIISEQIETESNLKESLLERINETHTIIRNIYKEYKDTHTKEEITSLVKTVLKDVRFNNGRGYFFIYDKNALSVFHPILPKLEGTSLINYQDSKGTYVLKEALSLIDGKDEAYHEWYWRKTKESTVDSKKIGFIKRIYELDWILGSGEYVDDFSKDIQQKVVNQINKFKFGNNRYVFAINQDNIYMSGFRKDFIGTSVLNQKNPENAKKTLIEMKEKSKFGGGFVKYVQDENPITKKPTVKISYVKHIPQWDWIIGSGFYMDEINDSINKEKEVLRQSYEKNLKIGIFFSILGALVLLVLTYYLSKRIEEKFIEYKKNIDNYINENQKQYEMLAQKSKLAAMGEMLENIAHQWRQPLSLITTASSAIQLNKEMNILTDKFLHDSLDSIGNSANHLSQTIDDFRDFFKPNKEEVNFNIINTVDKVFKLTSSQLISRNISIIKNIEDIEIKGFERELLQVLLNILNNAKDALELRENDRYIFIDIFKEKENVVIEIKDNAGGVDEEIINRVFEPYFTTKHQSQGTGIGLHMSQEIIARHMNGSLTVHNTTYEYEDKKYIGAIFIITLPLSQ